MRIGSICSGIAGLDVGVAWATGASTAWFCEREAAPRRVLERHFPGVPIYGDVTSTDWDAVEPVDIITAGYPCQPFSFAGQRKGTDDDRHLWPFVADAIRRVGPRWVALENVRGHISMGFDAVLGELADLGFDAEWAVFRASDVGAPHRRERVFVVARHPDRVGRGPGTGLREGDTIEDGHVVAGTGRFAADTRRHGTGKGHNQRDDDTCLPGALLPNADGDRCGVVTQLDSDTAHPAAPDDPDRRHAPRCGDDRGRPDMGRHEAAVRRWERIHGPAPHPLDGGRLNPAFVCWMQGYPAGWVDGLSRSEALKALGNAVVPHVAALAWQELAA